jgi:predicted MPP superfamily phosphohydrolase
MIFITLITPTPFVLQKYGVENYCTNLLIWAGSFSLGFFTFVSFFLVTRDLTLILIGFIRKFFRLAHNFFCVGRKTVEPIDINRRHFMLNSMNLGILGISGALVGYGFIQARCTPAVVEVSIPFHNLPEGLEGFRIVQITDTHVGHTTRHDYMETVVERVNMLTPDIIVFTGDIADGTVSHLRDKVSPLANLSANYGSYFTTGNHEYLFGEQTWLEEMDRLGLKVLLNEHQILQCGKDRITLAGVTDHDAGRFNSKHTSNTEASLSGALQCNLKILLAHQPQSIYAASQSGFHLQISGHTHGGHFYPWRFACFSPFIAGLYKFENTWIYVSRGTGYWGAPLRLGVTSEITLIKLTSGNHTPNLA